MRINNQILGNELTIKNQTAQATEINSNVANVKSAVQFAALNMAVKEGLDSIMALIGQREDLVSKLPEELQKTASEIIREAFHQKQISESGLPSIITASKKVNEKLANLLEALETDPGIQLQADPDGLPQTNPSPQPQTNSGTQLQTTTGGLPQNIPSPQPQTNPGTQLQTTTDELPQNNPSPQPQTNPGTQLKTTTDGLLQNIPSPQPQTNPGTQLQTTTDGLLQTNPSPQPQTNPGIQLQADPDGLLQTNPSPQPQINPGIQLQADPDGLPQTNPSTQSQANPGTQLQADPDGLPQTNPSTQSQAKPGIQLQADPDGLPQINPGILTEPLKQYWRKTSASEQEKVIKTLQSLIDTYKNDKSHEIHHNRSTGIATQIPIYFEENTRAYPAYIHIYYDHENSKASADEHNREIWLRICLLTENLGPVDVVFRLYNKNNLDIRLSTATCETGVFKSVDLKSLLSDVPMQINNIVIKPD